MPSGRVVPWISDPEFVSVARMVVGKRDLRRAEDLLRNWSVRVDRLPTGAEVTLHLLAATNAASGSTDSALVLSGAVTRFVNLLAQMAERRYGFCKLYEVAAAFHWPEWVVQVRNDLSHGGMPAADQMRRAAAFAMDWIRENYWRPELDRFQAAIDASKAEDRLASSVDYNNLHDLLDCHMYLKVYSMWGTGRIGEIRQLQDEVYARVDALWKDIEVVRKAFKKRRNGTQSGSPVLDDMPVNEAVHVLRNELDRRLREAAEDDERCDFMSLCFARTMTNDQLLLPEESFLDSLKEDGDGDGGLPNNLTRLWHDVLKIAGNYNMLPQLCRSLLEKASASAPSTSNEKLLARQWLKLILTAPAENIKIATPKGKKKAKSERADNSFSAKDKTVLDLEVLSRYSEEWKELLGEVLNAPPDAVTFSVAQDLFKLQRPRLEHDKERMLLALMETYMGTANKPLKEIETEQLIKTVSDVNPATNTDGCDWTEVSTVGLEWRDCPLGLLPWQDLHMINVPAMCEEQNLDIQSPPESPLYMVEKVDWDLLEEEGRMRRDEERFRMQRKRASDLFQTSETPSDSPTQNSGAEEESNLEVVAEKTKVPYFYGQGGASKPSASGSERAQKRRRR